VNLIFIFCGNKKCYKEWLKIKEIFTEIASICETLKQAAQQCEQNAISMSFMSTGEDLSKKKLDQLDASFMYTQISKDILLIIKFEEKHLKKLIEYCRDIFKDNVRRIGNY